MPSITGFITAEKTYDTMINISISVSNFRVVAMKGEKTSNNKPIPMKNGRINLRILINRLLTAPKVWFNAIKDDFFAVTIVMLL